MTCFRQLISIIFTGPLALVKNSSTSVPRNEQVAAAVEPATCQTVVIEGSNSASTEMNGWFMFIPKQSLPQSIKIYLLSTKPFMPPCGSGSTGRSVGLPLSIAFASLNFLLLYTSSYYFFNQELREGESIFYSENQ